jgi:hypothetical protein
MGDYTMKIGGIEITGELAEPNEEVLVLPRRKTQIVITARALPNMEDFDKRVPAPEPPKNFVKGKNWVPNLEDPTYKQRVELYSKMRVAYFAVASLQDIEWTSVDIDNPSTWINWEQEFKGVGFTQHECNLILQLCFSVNQLDEQKLEQARALFVLGQEQEIEASSSQRTEQQNTPSGGPVKDSESNPQD